MEYRIEFYRTENRNEPFTEWLASLKDIDTQALILQRLQRVKLGNFGDCEPIDGGLWEFRIHAGPGFRIYTHSSSKVGFFARQSPAIEKI